MNARAASRSVLLVEDDESIIEFVSLGLGYEGFDVQVARNGLDALHVLRRQVPDLLLLDLMLPGASGMEILTEIRRRRSVPVIILSARDEVADRVAGLEAGADDYLPKPFRFEELLARIKAVMRRVSAESEDVLHVGELRMDLAARTVMRDGRPVELTAKEFDLLAHLLANHRRVQSKDVLLDRVWGFDHVGETNIIEVHISNLRRKLGEGPALIHTVRGVGYVVRSDP